jgi:hypothetical protein
VTLKEENLDPKQLPPFEEARYVRADEAEEAVPPLGFTPTYYLYPPYRLGGYPAYGPGYYDFKPVEIEKNIPEETVALEVGSNVVSSDGDHVGDVGEVLIDPETSRATHFVISQGLLFKERKLIPLRWVKTMVENEVHLGVPTRVLDRLPDYQYKDS